MEQTNRSEQGQTPANPLRPAGTTHSLSDPYKRQAFIAVAVIVVTMPVVLGLIYSGMPNDGSGMAAGVGGVGDPVAHGRMIYESTCAVCHGSDAEGMPRLGKPLRNSAFVQGATDAELHKLIVEGRPTTDPANTTHAEMPPRGNKNLDDHQIDDVIAYLRSIQDSDEPVASVEAWNIEMPDLAAITAAASSGDASSDGEAEAGTASGDAGGADTVGHQLFVAACSACHGVDGAGMEGLGKPLTTSEFVASKTDKELMDFVKVGRPIWDAANTTGVDMPPKGGNPALTDEQLAEIIKHIRAIHVDSGQ